MSRGERVEPGKGAVDLTRRSLLNTIASVFVYAVRIGVGLVLNPFLLSVLGSGAFGVWQVCQRLLTYVESADGRASQALKWTVAHKQRHDDVAAKRRDVGSALVIWFLFLPVLALLGGLLSWFAPLLIRDLPADMSRVVQITCAVLMLRLLLTGLAQIPEAVLQGMHLSYKATAARTFVELAGGAGMAAAVWLGWGLPGLAGAMTLTVFISAFIFLHIARRNIPWFGAARPGREDVRGFFGFSVWVFAWTFVNKALLFSDIVILGLVAGASTVTVFTMTQYPIQMGVYLMAMGVSGAIPGLGGIIGAGELRRAARVRSEMMIINWLCLAALGGGVLLWNASFIGLWVGSEQFGGHLVNLLLVLMTLQTVFIRTDAFIIDVTLNIRRKVTYGAASAALALSLAYWGGRQAGIAGLIIGLMAGRGLLTVLYPLLVGRLLRIDAGKHFRGIARPAAATAVILFSARWLGMRCELQSWWRLAGAGLLSAPALFGAAYLLGLNVDQRRLVRERTRQILRRR